MSRELRAVLTSLLVALLVIHPAAACHYYGYHWSYSALRASYCQPVRCCVPCDGEVVYDEPSVMPGPDAVRAPVEDIPAAPELPPQQWSMEPQEMEVTPVPALPTEELAAEELATEEESSSTLADDLFGPTSTPAAEPTTDLFTSPTEEPSEEAVLDSPISVEFDFPISVEEQPAAEMPVEEPTSEPAAGDFFGLPTEDTTPPAEEEESTPTEDVGDLFDFGAILREPGGLASVKLRKWVDNTGRYSCRGRLIHLLDGKVQLLKDNGRTSTLPLGRLSKNDLQFVYRQASAQRTDAVGRTAQVSSLRPSH